MTFHSPRKNVTDSSPVPANPTRKRVIVIGAGAAGLMAALFAARDGAETLLLDSTRDGGKKILVSGGGRCNILPTELDERRFITDSSIHSMHKMLRGWPLHEQRRFFEEDLQLPLSEEMGTKKLFPASQRARDVRDGLMERARQEGARFRGETRVTSITPEGKEWKLMTATGDELAADAVIVATGGLSVPTTGSDGSGFAFARTLGIPLHPLYAALTPLTSDDARFTALSGIALDVTLTAIDGKRRAAAHGALLFTHRGYSGPVVLDVSHVIVRASEEGRRDVPLLVQWTSVDEHEWQDRFRAAAASSVTVLGLLRRELPERLAETLCAFAQVPPDRRLAQLRRDERARLLQTLCQCPLPWNGHEGYRKAEVTGGGIPLSAVHPVTMESRMHPGLHFCGEVLDVFGPIGGFNFYWAWATGRAAGMGAAAGTTTHQRMPLA